MSCWVVPGVAAELWGVPLEHVLELIRLGKVPAKHDYHFTLVDVAPHSPQDSPQTARAQPRMPTFRPITLIEQFADSATEQDDERISQDEPLDESSDENPDTPLNWKEARRRVIRRPPSRHCA